VNEALPRDVRKGLAQRRLDPDPVDVAHRVHECVELRQHPPFGRIERANSDERDAAPVQRGQAVLGAVEPRAGQAERGGQRHPVHVSARRSLGPVQIGVGVEPKHPSRPGGARQPSEGPERNRVVAAEGERHKPVSDRPRHESGNPATRLLDLREKSHSLVANRTSLGDGRLHVAPVLTAPAELFDPRVRPA
jgi:hypothetical protein